MKEIIEKEKYAEEMGKSITVDLLDLFEKDPQILSRRLDVLIKILFLSSYLRIDAEEIIDDVILILLGRPREQNSTH